MGTQPVDEYCREIETYLCRKNDGHLIRVVGPSFEVVSGWADQGVPLKVAFSGIDRYFERYYRKGARRRPVKVDFCDADVLDVFDEWKRATGVVMASASSADSAAIRNPQSTIRNPSLPAHLERVVLRLTSARAGGTLGDEFDALIDRVSAELDAARARAGGVRGAARQTLLDRLAALDAEVLHLARSRLDESVRASLEREAESELAGFRAGMTAEAFARALNAALDRLVRERARLPTIAFV